MENWNQRKGTRKAEFSHLTKNYSFSILILFCLLSAFACGGGNGSSPTATPALTLHSTSPAFEIEKAIGPEGGTVEVTNPNSPIYGVKLEIPEGALTTSLSIRINGSSTAPPFSSDLKTISPGVEISAKDTKNLIFSKQVLLTLPYNNKGVQDEYQLMVMAYEELSNRLDPAAIVKIDKSAKTISVYTTHCTKWWVLDTSAGASINQAAANEFGTEDYFPRANYNICPIAGRNHTPGHAHGIAAYAAWYFQNHRPERTLYNAYDETTSKKIACDATEELHQPITKIFSDFFAWWLQAGSGSFDPMTANSLIVALRETRNPQLLLLSSGIFDSEGHAVVAYAWERPYFHIYDPNPPHQKTLKFDGLSFGKLEGMEGKDFFFHAGQASWAIDAKMKSIYEKNPPQANYLLKYNQDFSSDPGWTTNNPSRFYRDPSTNTFYALTVEGASEYATTPVNWTGDSFKIEFDIKIAASQRDGGIRVGLFDSAPQASLPNGVDVTYASGDAGLHVNLNAANATTSKETPASIQNVQQDVWYHNVITWDKNTGVVKLELTQTDDNSPVGTYTLDDFTSFASNMVNLGVSWVGQNASTSQTLSYIGNVKFYEKQEDFQTFSGSWGSYYINPILTPPPWGR